MSRLSAQKRRKIYEQLAHRDSEMCYIGMEPGSRRTLVVDHLNNDSTDNRPANLYLVCREINSRKNPRLRSRKHSSESVCQESVDQPRASSAEFEKNRESEPAFNHFLFEEVWRKGKVELDDLVNCGAAVARCSPYTVRRRYLPKQCSRVRPYQMVDDENMKTKYVIFRPKWERARKKEEKRRKLDRQARSWSDNNSGDSNTSGIDKSDGDGSNKVHELRRVSPD